LVNTPPSAAQSTLGVAEMCSLSPQLNPRAHSFDLGLLSSPMATFLGSQALSGQQMGGLVPPHGFSTAAAPTNAHHQSFMSALNVPGPAGMRLVVAPSNSSQPNSPATFEQSPPLSAGLAAPVPVNPGVQSAAPLNNDQLLSLVHLLYQQQQQQFVPTAPPPTTQIPLVQLPMSTSTGATTNIGQLQQILAAAALLQQQQLSSPSAATPSAVEENGVATPKREDGATAAQSAQSTGKSGGFIDVCSV